MGRNSPGVGLHVDTTAHLFLLYLCYVHLLYWTKNKIVDFASLRSTISVVAKHLFYCGLAQQISSKGSTVVASVTCQSV